MGDIVCFNRYAGHDVELEGKTFRELEHQDITSVQTEEEILSGSPCASLEPKCDSILQSEPWVREYLEVVFDNVQAKAEVRGFICKVCWEHFDKSRQQKPYQHRRRLFLSGEDILETRDALITYFEVFIPEAGTWKFRCPDL